MYLFISLTQFLGQVAVLAIRKAQKLYTYRALLESQELTSARLLCLASVPKLMEDKKQFLFLDASDGY
jgi:hypothetical protein